MLQYKTFALKVEDTEEEKNVGMIKGYASTFGNVDLGGDIVHRGAFKKTIKDKKGKFPILLDHMWDQQIGWNLSAEEDDHGLKVEGEIQLITEAARNRFALAKRAHDLKTKMGLSIGYRATKEDFEDIEVDGCDDGRRKPRKSQLQRVRNLRELKLFEYSMVTFPMNEQAGVTDAKSEFIAKIRSGIYTEEEIKKALATLELPAAPNQDDPDLLQSFQKLKNVFKT